MPCRRFFDYMLLTGLLNGPKEIAEAAIATDLSFSNEQVLLQDSARRFLAQHGPVAEGATQLSLAHVEERAAFPGSYASTPECLAERAGVINAIPGSSLLPFNKFTAQRRINLQSSDRG